MGAVSPGDSNQKIMGSFRFGIALLVLVSVVTAKDVFRYDDEKTGQSHYMTGDPGASVEGGWAFTNPDGTFELVYKADEGGFQPAADHIPISVEDTNDVAKAKTSFYTLFEEHKAKVAEAEESREKRSPQDVFRYEDAETGQSHYMTGEPGKAVEGGWTFSANDESFELTYKADKGGFQPEAAHIPVPVENNVVPVEDTQEVVDAKAKFYSLYEEHKAKVEAAIAEKAAAVVDARRKRSPQDVFRYEDAETGQSHYMTGEPGKAVEGGWTFTTDDQAFELAYKANEGGFQPEAAHIPVPVEDTSEVAEAKAKFLTLLEAGHAYAPVRRKRSPDDEKSQDLVLPPHPYNFPPFLGLGAVKPEDSENQLYKYIPYYGFVPAEEEEKEENVEEVEGEGEEEEETVLYKYDPLYGFVKADQEIKPLEEQEYKYTPYVGFVPVTGEEDEDLKTYKFNPFYGFVEKTDEDKEATAEEMKDQQYKFVPFYGFVPVNEDGEIEETAKDYGNLKYTFHPYYGFLPTPTDGEDKTQLYKLDPVVGFYPSEKTEEVEEEVAELEAKRRKREAQFLISGYPVFTQQHILPLYPQQPPEKEAETPARIATEEEKDEE